MQPPQKGLPAAIKSAASAASPRGGWASSQLYHGLKFEIIMGVCTSNQLISEFSDCPYTESIFLYMYIFFACSYNFCAILDHIKFQALVRQKAKLSSCDQVGFASIRLDHGVKVWLFA